ncbi:TonB-dependent receptor [Aliikangiella sp. IMCC44359]|uniref:TonB-dependent receptor n=1 Tax=Aliikangiella sp. IMCC44359 TaxID=3459125 RepID=UPI00403B32D4
MKQKHNLNLNKSLLSLAIASTFSLSALTSYAAESDVEEENVKENKIQITGSRILRTDLESSKPVTIITKEDILNSGLNDIASVLAQSIFNTNGTSLAHSNNSAGNFSASNLRGLGSNRTLTLVNGRRVAGTSSLAGSTVNLNMIPIEVVERIDILRDGASSIYGSDAMGGVINIITKDDYDGMQISLNASRATQGGAEQTGGSLTFGSSNNKSSLLVVLEHQRNGSLKGGERPHLDAEHNPKRWSGRYSPWGSYYQRDDFVDRPSSLCPQENIQDTEWGQTCGYDVMDGKYYLPELDKTSVFTSFNYQISNDISFYNTIMYTQDNTFTSSTPMWAWGIMTADNPNNPTFGTPGAVDVSYTHYMEGSVPREFTFKSQLLDINAGVDWETDAGTLNVNLSHSEDSFTQESNYYYFRDKFQEAVDAGLYNPLAPAGGPLATQEVLDTFRHTQHRVGSSISKGVNINWAGLSTIELPGGDIGYAVGAEYRELSTSDKQDAQSNTGNVLGAYGGDTIGNRNYKAAYIEVELPVLENLTVTTATRYDSYSLPDQGQASSSASVRYEPTDKFVVRASFSQGFRVGDLTETTGDESVGYQWFTDPKYCNPVPVDERADSEFCKPVNQAVRNFANPDLLPEESEQISAGIAFNATNDLSFTLDYWNIEITNQITSITAQTILDEEYLGNLDNYTGLYVNRDLSTNDWREEITEIGSTVTNYLGLDTTGIDFSVTSNFDFGDAGTLTTVLETTFVTEYNFQTTSLDPEYDYVGYYSRPEKRALLKNSYTNGAWKAFLNVRYVDSFLGETPEEEANGEEWLDYPAITTVDVGVSYDFDDYGTVRLVSTNVTDKLPPVNTDVREGYNYTIHSIIGRTIQLSYTKSF